MSDNCGLPGCTGESKKCAEPGCDVQHPNMCSRDREVWFCHNHGPEYEITVHARRTGLVGAYTAGTPSEAFKAISLFLQTSAEQSQKDLFNEDVLEAPKPKRRVIHVDQGRRATNIVNKVDNPIIRMDNERGDPLAWGGTLTMVCHCGRTTCRFVQPKPDRAYVIVEDHVLIIDDEDKREE